MKKFKKIYIIAEAGVNHNGKLSLAKKLIDVAKNAKADAIKFQSFKAANLSRINTPKAKYQKKNTKKSQSHFEMLKSLELSEINQKKLFYYCKKKKIDFISTPYDLNSAKFLKKLGVNFFKTASADITDFKIHNYLSKSSKYIIISTGMSSINEIKDVLKLYKNKKKIILLHCVSNYPCSNKSLNLKNINLLKDKFDVNVGFSDHSKSYLPSIISTVLGAKIIEKHITLNKKMLGPDHAASVDPKEFKLYVENIRDTELMLGQYKRIVQREELEMRSISRKSLCYKNNFLKGNKILENDINLLRPGNGINPMSILNFVNKKLRRNVKKDANLNKNDFKKK